MANQPAFDPVELSNPQHQCPSCGARSHREYDAASEMLCYCKNHPKDHQRFCDFVKLIRDGFVLQIGQLCSAMDLPRHLDEDIAQVVFIDVIRALPRYDCTKGAWAWLRTIAVNRTIDQKRKRGPARIYSLYPPREDCADGSQTKSFDPPASEETQPETILLAKEAEELRNQQRDRLLKAIACLPMNEQVAIKMWLENRSYRAISDVLNIPLGSVGTVINRAIERLCENL